jgi:uncharacterized membrane protein YagU involved in acid resistance
MKPNTGRSIAGGFVGTLLMTLMIYFAAPMMGVHMDIAGSLAKMMHTSWLMGLLIHFVLGTFVFASIYSVIYRAFRGPSIARGIEWGFVLWFLMELFVMPMLGSGVFNSVMGGAKTAMAALAVHLVYGAVLGWIAGAAEPRLRVGEPVRHTT